ncbi:MAG: AAA family ATPase, partial [Nanoarchaeota archaeon]|nr:AAA family ATPase [Nanoarchaeota archaeon]
MWAEKHRPKCIKEIQGQELAFLKLNDFIKNFNTKRNTKTGKNAVLLYGPSGTGKNSLIYIVAKELDYDVIEFNASKLRDSKIIKGILKPATQQKSLFGKGSIIFIDEAEAFTWFDRGGLSAIISLIEETKWPLIFAANDLWDKKLNELRSKVEKIEFRKLDSTCITKVLQNICEKENLQISKEVLEKIALKSKGDARGAINDLQSLAFIEINDSVINTLGEREKDESIFQALSLIFKGKPQDSLAALENVNMPLDECFLWIDENLPLEYSGKELAQAYD